MKRARSAAEPAERSLREMPEVDFAAYCVRKNPFAERIAREGIEIVAARPVRRQAARERDPSARSLQEMPEVNLTRAKTQPNPYAERIAREGLILPGGRSAKAGQRRSSG